MVTRTQALVLGFFVVALVSLLMILVAAPDVYEQALRLPDRSGVAEVAFLAVLTGFLGLLTVGVLRRWRWTFWLVLLTFLAGVLRVPVTVVPLIRDYLRAHPAVAAEHEAVKRHLAPASGRIATATPLPRRR